MLTATETRRSVKAAAPVHGVVRLTLAINGTPYVAHPRSFPDGARLVTLRKPDGTLLAASDPRRDGYAQAY